MKLPVWTDTRHTLADTKRLFLAVL